MRKPFIAAATAVLVAAVAACGGSESPPNPYVTGMQALPNIQTQKTTSTVVLPTGSSVRPEQLTVLSMIDQAVPAANGQFSISSSNSGSQVVTGPGSWSTYESILDTIQPGQFLFISPTSDNLGDVTITTVTPLPNNQILATFTFTEGSISGSSTRTYQGAGSFIIPAPPTTNP